MTRHGTESLEIHKPRIFEALLEAASRDVLNLKTARALPISKELGLTEKDLGGLLKELERRTMLEYDDREKEWMYVESFGNTESANPSPEENEPLLTKEENASIREAMDMPEQSQEEEVEKEKHGEVENELLNRIKKEPQKVAGLFSAGGRSAEVSIRAGIMAVLRGMNMDRAKMNEVADASMRNREFMRKVFEATGLNMTQIRSNEETLFGEEVKENEGQKSSVKSVGEQEAVKPGEIAKKEELDQIENQYIVEGIPLWKFKEIAKRVVQTGKTDFDSVKKEHYLSQTEATAVLRKLQEIGVIDKDHKEKVLMDFNGLESIL
ncbi:MAG: hypothetical protein AAB886_01535, partial [Patescibacteria group bacterium]